MNELALFAGAGGGILGGKLLGWRTVCAVEIDAFCREVLLRRQLDGCLPKFPIWDDIRTFDGKPWQGFVDVISGGFPCQAWSSAARGRNNGADMWPQMLRVVGQVEPKIVFSENVDEGAILMAQKDLADCGYKTIRCKISAADLGADHHRTRWWLLAHTYNKGKLFRAINAKMGLLPEFRCRVWGAKPDKSRISNGLAYRMDRFRAIGNGQVPAVVRLAWSVLSGMA
jgi:DNA (cytosine-5)-methyltransferase 1